VYVRLWTSISGSWQYNDYSYTASGTPAACSSGAATVQSPAGGSVLSASATFSWSASCGASAYWIYVGTAQGSANVASQNMGLATSFTANNIPAGGIPIYVRLWTLLNGSWRYVDSTYISPR
jgi:hypothetical protein